MALSPVGELAGRVLAGRYRLTAPVGVGASAQVYVADDVQLRRRVAVKVLHPALADDPTFLRRFQAEAQAAAALNHPNIVAVYDWGNDGAGSAGGGGGVGGELPFLVTEYLAGGSLRELLGSGVRLTLSQTLLVGLEAARGLHYAHSRGFVHRDVKPANLLFGEDHRLRVADFGLARALAEATWTEPEGVVLGTARYVSPEQAAGGTLDGRSDVYSLALVLVECVTGEVPHRAESAVASLQARIGRAILAPPELGLLGPIVEAAGRADPARRSNAAELGRALMAAASRLPAPEPLPLRNRPLPPPGEAVGPSTRLAPVASAMAAGGGPAVVAGRAGGAPAARNGAARADADVAAVADVTAAADADVAAAARTADAGKAGPAVGGWRSARRARRKAKRAAGRARTGGRRRAARWVAGLLFVAALATLIALTLSLRGEGASTPKLVAVGNYVGQQIEALVLPAGAGWEIDRQDGRRDGSQVGEILAQEPAAGEQLLQGRTLRLTVSLGDELRPVPDVANLAADEARRQLVAAGFVAGADQARADEQVEAGRVIEAVQKGQQLTRGSIVQLVVSSGPAPRRVPDLAGQSPEQARATLQGLRLVPDGYREYSESVGEGEIIRTEPAAGSEVPAGATVTVVRSQGPRPIPVPELRGTNVLDAFARLRELGLSPVLDGAPDREVIATSPVAGESARRGDTISVITRR